MLRAERSASGVARRVTCRLAVALVVLAAGCSDDDSSDSAREVLPEPVEVAQEPEAGLADPAFEALPGARADFGRLGGAVYQIEMPDDWNGRLVLWMHGFQDLAPEASASAPDIRSYLIARGYAWGASSFSSTSWIPGRAADETAALWDHFAEQHGRPRQSYLIGLSMGGTAAHIAAERYGDRFDGVLGLCGTAGASPGLANGANMFVAAAYAAGVTQTEFDAASDIGALIRERIRPALEDAGRRDRFERIMVDLTGGPRPFDREGIRADEETNWRRLELSIATGVVPPRGELSYDLGPTSGISDEEFNRAAIRLPTDEDNFRAIAGDSEITGDLQVPLLTLHTTGDGQVPIEQTRILRSFVDDADRSELLVQRVFRDPGHCGFTSSEWADGFEALVDWVEDGDRPGGNDVLGDDLGELDPSFELQPRPGTPEADDVPGADERVVVAGTATLNGRPFDARWLGAVVLREGLMTPCQYELTAVTGGRFEVTVLAEAEAAGCGSPGAEVVLWTYAGDVKVYSAEAIPWPAGAADLAQQEPGRPEAVDVPFSTATPQGAAPEVTELSGEVLDEEARYVRPGTRIEAFAGDVRCGVASTRRTGSFAGYILAVVRSDAVPGCASGATLTFHVDGEQAAQTATNDPDQTTQPFELTL